MKIITGVKNIVLMAIFIRVAYIFTYWTFDFNVLSYLRLWALLSVVMGLVAWLYGDKK